MAKINKTPHPETIHVPPAPDKADTSTRAKPSQEASPKTRPTTPTPKTSKK